jgi:glucose-1-phosphate adenylyltransferase
MLDTMGLIFTYKYEEDLKTLTQVRSISSIPFGGRYRIIDFLLSSMVNSGITKIGMITKNNYQSLMDHVGSGKEWDLSRKRDGLYILPPFSHGDSFNYGANYRGRMEALANTMSFIRRSNSEYVLLSDADIICNMTFDKMLEFHKEKDADITLLYKNGRFTDESYNQFCFLAMDKDHRVTDVAINPAKDRKNLCIGTAIIRKSLLESLIQECQSHNLYSFRRDVLQANVKDLKIYGYECKAYMDLITSVSSYFDANMDLLNEDVRKGLFDSQNQIFTKIRDEVPSVYRNGSKVSNSLIADGCIIEGTVENSIIFRGVRIRKGAVVSNSIIMQDCEIQSSSQLNYVIADKDVVIRENRKLFGYQKYPTVLSKGSVV